MAEWRNRIVEYGQEDPEDLLANPRNWRIHPKMQQDALSGVLDEIGWIDDVIVNKRTGFVVDGHLRVSLAISKGDGKVPVKYVDLSEEEEMVILATLDPIAAMAATDKDKLAEVFELIQSDNEQVLQLLDEIAKKERIEREVDEDPGAQIDKADELQEKWQVERGQVWQIGSHRLMCGNSTSEDDVGLLMVEEKAGMVFTDPPYGIDYQDIAHKHERIKGDKSVGGATALMDLVFENECPIYICCNWKSYSAFERAMIDKGKEPKACIVWDKNVRIQNLDKYFKQHEFILYHGEFGGETTVDGDVWRCDRQTRLEHPTAKPTEIIGRAIRYSSALGNIVQDLFIGSGSTMVACEQTHRICYGMEIEPKYCAVTLERMSQMGLEPALHKTYIN